MSNKTTNSCLQCSLKSNMQWGAFSHRLLIDIFLLERIDSRKKALPDWLHFSEAQVASATSTSLSFMNPG